MITFGTYTNPGNRDKNEDNFGVAINEESFCFVVADGLGGHGGGEIASRIAVDTFCEMFVVDGWSDNFFEKAFSSAQSRILHEQEVQHAPSKMKTTLVVLVLHDNKAYIAHIGDSRVYYLKNMKIKKRTLDHSVPQMLALSKAIREEDIRKHPDRSKVMRVLGIKGESPRYEMETPIKLSGKQDFFLCTDGYWEPVEERVLEEKLVGCEEPQQWIENLNEVIQEETAGEDSDNYTCIAVRSRLKGFFG